MSDVQKFQFAPEHDGSLSLESAVFQALGAASTCWDPMDGTGIFQSDVAKAIGDALLEKINNEMYPKTPKQEGLIDLGPGAFTNGEVINYEGANYYKACDVWVTKLEGGGQSYCVKRVGHPGFLHEDYDGNVRGDHS